MSGSAYADDLTKSGVSGTTIAINDIISEDFTADDLRYLVVDVQGGLTNFRLQGRVGSGGSWRTIKTQVAGTRLVFDVAQDNDLLDDRLRIQGLAAANVDNVFITRMR
jgi:hypothetical protein